MVLLRNHEYKVTSIQENWPGILDNEVIQIAIDTN
ncbi:MAG: hypothetical protein ICV81_05585 [Flavisolibacter sp.]|nr:hypothetical protein [Flavisolibacter sp.]MBD0294404.1 hypothetical protein [Flavisolibacter sp.]MBD0352716.1 hypothetical protein [Flavisolibacter sp.]